MKSFSAFLIITAVLLSIPPGQAASYTTSWVGNTGETPGNYVGNCARSLWVSPEGIVYTASIWDENGRNIGVYQNGAVLEGMGGTKESQGSAISGDSTHIFTAQQFPNGGKVGRYNRTTKARDLLFAVSDSTQGGDVITGLAVSDGLVYSSDFPGNRVRVFTVDGVFQREWSVPSPGAIAVENDGAHLWIACQAEGTIRRYNANGSAGITIRMDANARPSALHINAKDELWIGDQGPDMNIKVYASIASRPVQRATFGLKGGYLSEEGGLRGQTGDRRFTRVVGIGSDQEGNVYVLNNPWGGTTDLGRDGATDLHCYTHDTGVLAWTLQALNFESVAAPDPGTDGTDLYSGNYIYTGRGQAGYKANTVDPFRYPNDARIDHKTKSRGEHFGQLAYVNGKRILLACSQNPDRFYTYYFNPATDGMIAIPGRTFGDHTPIRHGFNLSSNGDIWTADDKTHSIQHYALTGFAPNGEPNWASPVSTPTPASIDRLNRLVYLPESDTMILAGGQPNWTLIGKRIEVYPNWLAGNRTPASIINPRRGQAKSMDAAGSYAFVGYYATNAIDIFDLTSGTRVLTLNSSDGVTTGNDVDSMYGIRAYKKTDGTYLITKDDYNYSKVVIYTFTP